MITDRNRRENCVFDVAVTGEEGFAKTYRLTEQLEHYGTTTTLTAESRGAGEPAAFLATVRKRSAGRKGALAGYVLFHVNGKPAGEPVAIDKAGRARFPATNFDPRQYRIQAEFRPAKGNAYLASVSDELGYPDRSDLTMQYTKPK